MEHEKLINIFQAIIDSRVNEENMKNVQKIYSENHNFKKIIQ